MNPVGKGSNRAPFFLFFEKAKGGTPMATYLAGFSQVAIEAIIRHTDPETLRFWATDDPTLADAIVGRGHHTQGWFFPNLPTQGASALSTGGGGSWKPVKLAKTHRMSWLPLAE